MSDRSFDIDAMMYAPFLCVDCAQEFKSRQELEEHEASIKPSQELIYWAGILFNHTQ